MQQQQTPGQARNTAIFVVIMVVILIGWPWVESKLFPPPFGKARLGYAAVCLDTMPTGTLADALRYGLTQRVLATPARDFKESAEVAAPEPAKPSPPGVPTLALREVLTAAADALPTGTPADALRLGITRLALAGPAVTSAAEVQLGDDKDFNLSVRLTGKGAGVRELVLTQFPAATWDGQPAPPGEKVRLLPESETASFRLYHYAEPSAPRPLDTLGSAVWEAGEVRRDESTGEQSVTFTTTLRENGLQFTKTFSLKPGDYHLGLRVAVKNPGANKSAPFRYQLAGGRKLAVEGEWFANTYRTALVGWTDKDGNVGRGYADAAMIHQGAGGDRNTRGDNTFRYAAVTVPYFASVIAVDPKQPAGRANFLEFARATDEERADSTKPFLEDITVRTVTEPLALEPGQELAHQYILYHGPSKVRLLWQMEQQGKRKVDSDLITFYHDELHLNTLTDYQSPGGLGAFSASIGWTRLIITFTNLMHSLLGVLQQTGVSLGLCIIFMTVLVRGMLFPLSRWQTASMMRMQEVMKHAKPELDEARKRAGDDFYAYQQAQGEIMRRYGINPAVQMVGCLLLFAQMPVFMGLYFALQESSFFRLDNFLWMNNLAAPDMLYRWGETVPWFTARDNLGGFFYLGPYLNILPLLSVALMLVQQTVMSPPATDKAQADQMRTMKFMTLFFGFMFYKLPAGLGIYFITTTVWGLAERYLVPKPKITPVKVAPGRTPAPAARPAPGPQGRDRRGKPSGPQEPETKGGKLKAMWDEMVRRANEGDDRKHGKRRRKK